MWHCHQFRKAAIIEHYWHVQHHCSDREKCDPKTKRLINEKTLAMFNGIRKKVTQIWTHPGKARNDCQQSTKILRLVCEVSDIKLTFFECKCFAFELNELLPHFCGVERRQYDDVVDT